MNRSPTSFEKYNICRNIGGCYTNFNVTGQYNKNVLSAALSQALKALISKNAELAVNFMRINNDDFASNGANFRLRPLNLIKFSDVVTYKKVESFDESILQLIDRVVCPMDSTTTPLWRVMVFETTTTQHISFICDHTLFDGNGGIQFHDDILEELAALSSDPKFIETIFENDPENPTVLPLNQEVSDMYKPRLYYTVSTLTSKLLTPQWVKDAYQNGSNFIRQYWKSTNPNYIDTNINPIFTHNPTRKGTPTYYKLINSTPAEVSKILKYCKANGITMTTYSIVLCLLCLQDTFFKTITNNGTPSANTDVAIDARRYLTKRPKYGLIVGAASISTPYLPLTPESLLPHMRQFAAELTQSVESKDCVGIVGLLDYVKANEFLEKKLDCLSRTTLDISNLGNKQFTHGDWKSENFVFSQSNGLAAYFDLSIISTPELGMNIVFGYLEDCKDMTEEIEQFAALYKERLVLFAAL